MQEGGWERAEVCAQEWTQEGERRQERGRQLRAHSEKESPFQCLGTPLVFTGALELGHKVVQKAQGSGEWQPE